MPLDEKEDVPTVGTPKRRGRPSVNPTPAAVASPVRVTRRSVAALANDVPTVGTPKRRGRPSVNPTQAAVASPVRVTRRSVAALAEEGPAVSSPRRKSRASINPSVTASPARVTRHSLAFPAAEEELETQSVHSPTRSRRKSTLPKGKSEAHDEAETPKEKSASITKIEESPECRPSSAEISDQVGMDTKPSQLPAADRTPETNLSTRTSRNTPSGSADDKTPETKIPTRRNRNTPPGSGSSEFRTPTRSQGGSSPLTPVSRNSPRNISDSKTSTKPSPDRHANCNSRDSSPIFTSCDLKRNYFSSPVRHSPRSSPSRQLRTSSGESKDASSKPSAETKPTSPLVSGKIASPSQPNNDRSPRSSPRVRNAAKGKETSVPEKHCLEDEDDSLMMPNKRIKRDTTDGEDGPSSSVEPLQKQLSPEKKVSASPKPEQKLDVSVEYLSSPSQLELERKKENTEHTSTVSGSVGVDGDDSEGNEEEARSNTNLYIPGIQKLSDAKTSSRDVKVGQKVDHLEETTVSDEATVREQTPPAKDEGSEKPGEGLSTVTSEESVKEGFSSPVLENDSPPTDPPTPSARGASLMDEPEKVVENKVGNEIAPSSCEEPQVLELNVQNSGPQKTAENEVKNDEHQEIEQSVIINDSDEAGVEEGGNPDQDERVVIAESPVSEESSDESPVNEDDSDVIRETTPTVKESIVTSAKCESEDGIISDQVEIVVNSESAVSENSPDASKREAHDIKESLDVSHVKSESEERKISDQGETVANANSPAKDDSSDVPSGETPTIQESLEVSPAKSGAPLNFDIPVDEGYSETSDSEYHSSAVGLSDKDVKVSSIVEVLGVNDTRPEISVTLNLANHADSRKANDRTLENIVEEDEDVSENSPMLQSKGDNRESKLSVSDQFVESSETNAVGATIDEYENADQPSCLSPLRLAVSPEPPGSVEDDSTSKDGMGSPSKDVDKHVSESLSVEDSGEKIGTTTVFGMVGLKKHVATSETKTVSGEEKIEQDECCPEICENSAASVGDSDEEKIRDATSGSDKKTEYEENKIEGALVAPQEECSKVYENDTASVGVIDEDTGDVNGPPKGSDFIDDEAEEGEETDEESENDENIYDATEESDSADSDAELLDQSCFIIDEALEAKSSNKTVIMVSSRDYMDENSSGGDGPETEVVERSGKVLDFDESCYIVENSDEGETPRELKSGDVPKNAMPESKISPKADQPVFKVTELLDADGTTVSQTQKFASGAASHFVTEKTKSVKMREPLKSIMKSSKALKNGNSYASTAASKFVVSKIATEGKQKKKQPKVVKRSDASTGSPQNSDSSFTSSDQEQENTERIPKTKKRSATEAVALKEKKYKKETSAPGFCVKLCNIAPRTSTDQLKKALAEFGIATGLLSLGFCPKTEKHKKTAIATYDSKKNLQRALTGYGSFTVHDRSIFFLLDDETAPISDDQPQSQAASPQKSPRKKFVGIIGDLPKDITIGDIIGAYEQEGIKFISKVKIYQMKSRKDNPNFAKLEFSKKTSLLKAIIVTEKIKIKGNKISLKIKEKPSIS